MRWPQGRRIIHMEFGQPSTSAPAAAHGRRAPCSMPRWAIGKAPAEGAHRGALCRNARRHDPPEQVILTSGASPALVLALSSALAPARAWRCAARLCRLSQHGAALHMEAVEVPCGAAEAIRSAPRWPRWSLRPMA
jgi:hypothetical protein